jgi:hypothetical protein
MNAEVLDVYRQSRQYVLDTVLRQHLRDVQIGPDPEGDCDGEVAIPRRLTAQVEHILDTVDFLLERCRYLQPWAVRAICHIGPVKREVGAPRWRRYDHRARKHLANVARGDQVSDAIELAGSTGL